MMARNCSRTSYVSTLLNWGVEEVDNQAQRNSTVAGIANRSRTPSRHDLTTSGNPSMSHPKRIPTVCSCEFMSSLLGRCFTCVSFRAMILKRGMRSSCASSLKSIDIDGQKSARMFDHQYAEFTTTIRLLLAIASAAKKGLSNPVSASGIAIAL